MTPQSVQESVKEKVMAIAQKREVLMKLSQRDDLGNLRIDVTQALEEIDDLIEELNKTFPDCGVN